MPSRASRARLHRARCTTTASEATEVLEHESPGAARYWGGFFWPRDDHRSATRAVLVRASRVGVGLSSLFPSTIAAPRAGRTVAGVIAIRAHPGAVDPDRKKPRQFQRGFKAAACTLRHERRAWTAACGPGLSVIRWGTREGSGAHTIEDGVVCALIRVIRFRLRYSRIHAALRAGSRYGIQFLRCVHRVPLAIHSAGEHNPTQMGGERGRAGSGTSNCSHRPGLH